MNKYLVHCPHCGYVKIMDEWELTEYCQTCSCVLEVYDITNLRVR